MMSVETDDRGTVVRCLRGESGAFREIMDRYKTYAMAVALNILLNREDAEDACQEAFFKAFRSLDRFDQGKSFKTWFAAILIHDCLSRLRKRKRFHLFLGRFKSEQPMISGPPPSASDEACISSVMGRLGPKERLALYLWAREGYSGDELSSVLGCSRNTAYVHLFRARVKLKSFLAEKNNAQL